MASAVWSGRRGKFCHRRVGLGWVKVKVLVVVDLTGGRRRRRRRVGLLQVLLAQVMTPQSGRRFLSLSVAGGCDHVFPFAPHSSRLLQVVYSGA